MTGYARFLTLLAVAVFATTGVLADSPDETRLANLLPKVFARADRQYRLLAAKTSEESARAGAGRQPRTFEKNKLVFSDVLWWTSGFFPGSLWYLYEATHDPFWREQAERFTEAQRPVASVTDNHDIGFMLYCSAGNALRITRDRGKWEPMLAAGATNLCTRFRPDLGLIQSWDSVNFNGHQTHRPVIIDNMMNLELLEWAAKNVGDTKAGEVALAHARTTSARHFRADDSVYHIVDYWDDSTNVCAYLAGQGASAAGTWARGQGWAIYGFTMMARETGERGFLERAMRSADWWLAAPNTPSDFIPYWDFNAPKIPAEPRDASAAALVASGLLELSTLVAAEHPAKAVDYRKRAVKMLLSLCSDEYLAAEGENGGFILRHSTGHKPQMGEVDVPLSYADYYFLEALLRFRSRGKAVFSDLDTIRERLRLFESLGSVADVSSITVFERDPRLTTRLIQTQNEDGGWSDVDYDSLEPGVWKPAVQHLSERTLYLARDYYQTRDPKTANAVIKALDCWLIRRRTCPNWWWNDIGAPQDFAVAALLVDDVLTDAARDRYADYLGRAGIGMTGQNRIWLARIALLRALIIRDGGLAHGAIMTIQDEVKVAEKEGIMDDWSYRLHGRQMQFGNYGASFILNMSRFARAFNGTRWEFPKEKLALLGNLEEMGFRWTLWNDFMDVSALGRQITPGSQRTKCVAVKHAMAEFAEAGWTFPAEPPIGFRYFPRSAYAVYRQPGWMASVKMHTHDILETETWVGGENSLGGHLADGAIFVYSKGSEYEDVFPLWKNWRFIPGVTTYRDLPPVDRGGYIDWPGANEVSDIGAKGDARDAHVSFTLQRDGLTAVKYWHFTPEYVECSGTSITATNDASTVITCVEHAWAAPGAGIVGFDRDLVRVRNGDFIYEIFAPQEAVKVSIEDRTGDWKGIHPASADRTASGKVLLITIDHGVLPRNAEYRYLIRPVVAAEKDASK